jgi:heme/copper-type cytochrome/quinol oxidase subunit 3
MSGITVTAAHAQLVENNMSKFFESLGFTIILGLVFLTCQIIEYKYGVNFS